MRQIGLLSNRADATRFAAYLVVQGISAQTEADGSEWGIWVRDEDQLGLAKKALDEFRADPANVKFHGVEQTAERKQREEAQKREAARQNVVTMGKRWPGTGPGSSLRRPLTLAVIVLCCIIAVATHMGENRNSPLLNSLLFSDLRHLLEEGPPTSLEEKLVDIRRGQIWRIITPAFVHFGPLHLAFNMVMFYQMASLIEHRRGSGMLALWIFAVAIPSNLAQALLPAEIGGSVHFGGLSGVVFGLLGFLWMKSRFDPAFGVMINRGTLLMAFVFLALGFVGLFNTGGVAIANWAHGVGFVTGMLIGWAPIALQERK